MTEKEIFELFDLYGTDMGDYYEIEVGRIALTTYNLPFQPTKLKNFDEFHQRYGKYILQASA
jgi:hypothetical protein